MLENVSSRSEIGELFGRIVFLPIKKRAVINRRSLPALFCDKPHNDAVCSLCGAEGGILPSRFCLVASGVGKRCCIKGLRGPLCVIVLDKLRLC